MWPFNKSTNKHDLKENNGLSLMTMRSYSGNYNDKTICKSCTVKKWAKQVVSKLSNYNNLDIDKRLSLVMISKWNGKYYPVVDADGESNFVKAGLWLDEEGITYSIIKSSTNHWYIVDKPYDKIKQAKRFSEAIPGNDKKYVDNCDLVLRLSIKNTNQNLPKIVHIGNHSAEFVKEIQNFLDVNENLIRYVDRFTRYHIDSKVLEDAGENKYGITMKDILNYA